MIAILDPRWAWLLLVLPLLAILYLIRSRPRVHMVGAIQIWQQIAEETGGGLRLQRWYRLRQLCLGMTLILLLIAGAVDIAFKADKGNGSIILIDNTMSMQAQNGNASLLESALRYTRHHAGRDDLIIAAIGDLKPVSDPDRIQPTWLESDLSAQIQQLCEVYPGYKLTVLTDRPVPAAVNERIIWITLQPPQSQISLTAAAAAAEGWYLTVQNTNTFTADIEILIAGPSGNAALTSRIDSGIHEIFVAGYTEAGMYMFGIQSGQDTLAQDNWQGGIRHGDIRGWSVYSPDLEGDALERYMQASGTRKMKEQAQADITIYTGSLPADIIPGNYLLINPQGIIDELTFQTVTDISGALVPAYGFAGDKLLPQKVQCPRFSRIQGQIQPLVYIDGTAAAGWYQSETIRAGVLCFDPDTCSELAAGPGGAVLIDALLAGIIPGGGHYMKGQCGDFLSAPPGNITISLHDTVTEINHPGGPLFCQQPGIYRLDNAGLAVINPPEQATGPIALNYAPEAADNTGRVPFAGMSSLWLVLTLGMWALLMWGDRA